MAQNWRRGCQNFEKKNWQGASRDSFFSGEGPEFLWPDIDILRLDIHILSPDIDILSPDIDILRPDSDILRPDIDIFSIKHDLARSCFQLWPKIGDEGDKISRKKTGKALAETVSPEGMVPNFEPKNDLKKGQICVFGSFLGPNWVVFRSERAVSTIFPPYIMPNGTYERKKKFSDTLPFSRQNF